MFKHVSFDLQRGERLLVLGPQRGRQDLAAAHPGRHRRPRRCRSYGATAPRSATTLQEHEALDPDATAMESLREVAKALDDLLRGVLGHFLLGGDQAHQPTCTSGGEKTKLALARLVLGRHNVLLLDEPTNNLDVQAVEAVRSALETYKGSVVLVSHDTPFVQRFEPRPGPAHARRRPRRVERGLPGPGRPGLSVTTVTILGAGARGLGHAGGGRRQPGAASGDVAGRRPPGRVAGRPPPSPHRRDGRPGGDAPRRRRPGQGHGRGRPCRGGGQLRGGAGGGRAAAAALAPGTPLLLCAKGFGRRSDGTVSLLPELVTAASRPPWPRPARWWSRACKANEVAAGRPTAAVFAGRDEAVVARCARALTTPAYRVARSDDLVGVEAAAATKNVYAIAVGSRRGLTEAGGEPA